MNYEIGIIIYNKICTTKRSNYPYDNNHCCLNFIKFMIKYCLFNLQEISTNNMNKTYCDSKKIE